jgi:putative salt-induced outer membrane protein YdiY
MSSADRFLIRFKLSARRTMKKHILIVLVLAGWTAGVRASDTNLTVTLPAHKPVWQSSIALGLTAAAGNSDSTLVTGNFETHKRMPRDEWSLGADAAYGEVDSVKNNESLHGFAQYNHLFDERWYGYTRAAALHDGIADVTYRVTLSPGVGYYFIKNQQTSLAAEFGPGAIFEKLDGEHSMYSSLRVAQRFEHKFNDHARLWQNVEFLPQTDKPDNFLVNAEIGMETTLTRQLSLQVYVQDSFANQPAPGRKNNDVKLVSALAIKF